MLQDLPVVGNEVLRLLIMKYFPHPKFNPGQGEAILRCCRAFLQGVPHFFLEAPTGSGKSSIGYTVAKVMDHITKARVTIATKSISLQETYSTENPEVADLKSKTNYNCPVGAGCYGTVQCVALRRNKQCSGAKICPYLIARNYWCNLSRVRSTNHAFMIHACDTLIGMEKNKSEFMILDEAHTVPQSLVDHSEVFFGMTDVDKYMRVLTPQEILSLGRRVKAVCEFIPEEPGLLVTVNTQMKEVLTELAEETEHLHSKINQWILDNCVVDYVTKRVDVDPETEVALNSVSNIRENCEILLNCPVDGTFMTYLVGEKEEQKVYLKPTHASYTAYYRLFRKSTFFLHMTATMCGAEAHAEQLGIPENEWRYHKIPSLFPVENRLVNYCPLGKFSNARKDMMMDRVVEAVDRILDKHRGENGIIHTVSYSNAKTLLEKCINSGRMKIPKDANDGMNILKKGNGAVLASPAMEEGYDLKGDLSRFQIIIKVPFGFLGDPLIKYQLSKWPHMYERDVVMRIVQGSGRSVRSETDYAVTYILDGMFGSLFRESREYFPDWYAEAVRKTDLEFVLAE